jgi:hypothetical protein
LATVPPAISTWQFGVHPPIASFCCINYNLYAKRLQKCYWQNYSKLQNRILLFTVIMLVRPDILSPPANHLFADGTLGLGNESMARQLRKGAKELRRQPFNRKGELRRQPFNT